MEKKPKTNRAKEGMEAVKCEKSSKTPETFQLLLSVLRGILNSYHKPNFSPFIRYSNPVVFIDGYSLAEQNFIICST